MSLEIVIVTVLIGIALGVRYKVLILVPAITFALAFAVIAGIAQSAGFWSTLLTMALLGTAVQFGYFIGILMRAAVGSIFMRTAGGNNLPTDER